MIEARPARWAQVLFRWYLRRLQRRHFHSLHLLGDTPRVDPDRPVLLLPNHSTWWDGFFALWINRHLLHRPFYAMMLESQLRNYGFFRRLGIYGIDPTNAKGTLASLRYTLALLKQDPPPTVCLFAQGELRSWGVRPLGFRRGLDWILARTEQPVTLLPLAIRVEMMAEQRPLAFFQLGEPLAASPGIIPSAERMDSTLAGLLDELAGRIAAGERNPSLLRGRPSVSEISTAVFHPRRYRQNR